MARRNAAATAKRPRVRSRQTSGTMPKIGTGSVGANGQHTPEKTKSSGAVELEALVVTHAFDSGEDGEPYSATIRLTGRRVGIRGNPKPRDTFAQEDRVDGVVPGSGPVSITTWVYGLQPGEWTVTGHLVRPGSHADGHELRDRWRRTSLEPLQHARWSWRTRSLSTGPALPLKSRWALVAPLARIPAVLPGSFPVLGTLGILIALIVQSVLVARASVSVGSSLAVSLLALAFGLIGAKVWYAVLHPGPWRQSLMGGWSVDGFLAIGPAVAVTTLLAFNLPIGVFLDATTPGLFFAVAIGRLGCFFTGCCAGRCTRSRWGVWSSDRRVGARRVPTQLLESGAGLLIGVAAALLVLFDAPGVSGLIFVAAFAAYIVVRQLLLRLRAERREYSWRRSLLVSS